MTEPAGAATVEAILKELSELSVRQVQVQEKLRKRLEPILEDRCPPRVTRGADEWAAELLDAARHDLRAAKVLAANTDNHAATVAMLLQMVFEKLAKAYLARTDWPAFIKHRRSHAAATRFTQFLKLNNKRLLPIGLRSSNVLAWVEALTRAHPAIAKNGPHLEYPWEQGERVCSPSRDLLIVTELGDARSLALPHLLRFASYFIQNFETIA
jgi:hypothetical protein